MVIVSGTTLNSEKYTFDSTDARYVRITVNGNTANNWAAITELDMFGSTSPPPSSSCTTNLLIGNVTASGNDGNVPLNVIDNNLTTRWAAINNNESQQVPGLILSENEEVKRQKGIWYNLKILLLKNNIEIYVNDILRINVPARDYAEKNIANHSISRVGINTYHSKSEFQPLILGQIPESVEQSYSPYQKLYYKHYYPLSMLALSKMKYDSFMDGDMSAFSKKYVILPFDISVEQENEASKYLEFVNKGGNLVIMNSDNFEGVFSKLLPVRLGNLTKFDSISLVNSNKIGEKKYSLNVSGVTKNIEVNPNSNLTVKSYYMNKDKSDKSQRVAPFAIEKNYGHGKIIFVNAIGYFDAIFGNSLTLAIPQTVIKISTLQHFPRSLLL